MKTHTTQAAKAMGHWVAILKRRAIYSARRGSQVVIRCIATLGLCVLGNQASLADISFHTDFESGSLNLRNTRFVSRGAYYSLVGIESWIDDDYLDYFRSIYFRAEGVENQQPKFQLGQADNRFLGTMIEDSIFYSYDQENWSRFDNTSTSVGILKFGNASPFTQDEVYISYSIPYPVSRTIEMVEQWSQSPFVSPTPSADAELQIGSVPNTTPYGPNELPLYGFKITDASSPYTKQSVVLMTGNHSGEMGGNWGFEGTVDFLLGDDPRARQLRERAEIFLYPQVDPLGRVEGYYRNNSQNARVDHNRAWDAVNNPTHSGFSEIGVVREAILADTAAFGTIDILIDYHGTWSPGPNSLFVTPEDEQSRLVMKLLDLEPEMYTEINDFIDPIDLPKLSRFAFDVRQPYTSEFQTDRDIIDYLQTGESYGIALHAAIVPEPADLNSDGFVEGLDLGILLGNFDQHGIPASRGELDGTAPVDGLDLGILLSAWDPRPMPSVAAVPEPSTLALAAGLAAVGLFARYGRCFIESTRL